MARIGIDLDGVCYDFVQAFRDHTGKTGPVSRWEFYKDWGIDTETFLKECRSALYAPDGMFSGGLPIPGSVTGVKTLVDAGHEIIFVTDRLSLGETALDRSQIRNNTAKWILRHFGRQNMSFTGDKGRAVKAFGIRFFLDDKPENFFATRDAGAKSYLFTADWNSHIDAPRVNTWGQFVEEVLKDTAIKAYAAPVASSGEVRVTSSTGGEKGQKDAQYGLIPTRPLRLLAELYGRGAQKYAERNWERGYDWRLSYDAAQRHMNLFWSGEDMDAETRVPHPVCAMFHMAALVEFLDTHPEFDTRSKR